MLNAKLEHHMARAHALLHEISAFIYIYIYYEDSKQLLSSSGDVGSIWNFGYRLFFWKLKIYY